MPRFIRSFIFLTSTCSFVSLLIFFLLFKKVSFLCRLKHECMSDHACKPSRKDGHTSVSVSQLKTLSN